MAHSKVVTAIVTPILDVMQTMPSFVYLLPFAILLRHRAGLRRCSSRSSTRCRRWSGSPRTGSGASPADDARGEPSRSASPAASGCARCELPMAKRTIIVGRQPDHDGGAVDGHHRGVRRRSRSRPAGARGPAAVDSSATSFVAGMCIVIMAIMLDRTTTAASERVGAAARAGNAKKQQRRYILGGGAVVAGDRDLPVAHTRLDYNEWPENWDIGTPIARRGRRLRRLADDQPVRLHRLRSRTTSPSGSSTRCRT